MDGDSNLDSYILLLEKINKGIAPYVSTFATDPPPRSAEIRLRCIANHLVLSRGVNDSVDNTYLEHANSKDNNICKICGKGVINYMCHTPCCNRLVCWECIAGMTQIFVLDKVFNNNSFVMLQTEWRKKTAICLSELIDGMNFMLKNNACMKIRNAYLDLKCITNPFCPLCEYNDVMYDMSMLPSVGTDKVNFFAHQEPKPNFTKSQVAYIANVWFTINQSLQLDVAPPRLDVIANLLQEYGHLCKTFHHQHLMD